jgi:hypothetical protein
MVDVKQGSRPKWRPIGHLHWAFESVELTALEAVSHVRYVSIDCKVSGPKVIRSHLIKFLEFSGVFLRVLFVG